MNVRQSSSSSLCSSKKQKMENDNKSLTTIECLPDELILQICSNVASNSTIDIMNLKRVSKRFLQICSDDQVLRCSVYVKYQPGWGDKDWNDRSREESESNYLKYIKSLRNAGNPYVLFYAGLDSLNNNNDNISCWGKGLDFLNKNNNISQDMQNKGLKQLIQAAEGGYMLARYIAGIVLYCRGGEETQKGIDFLTTITKPSDSMASILKEVEAYRRNMNRIFYYRYWGGNIHENLKEQYESDTVKCNCNGTERKWFKENCRGENCWGNGKDLHSSFICQACLAEEIVYQFVYGLRLRKKEDGWTTPY